MSTLHSAWLPASLSHSSARLPAGFIPLLPSEPLGVPRPCPRPHPAGACREPMRLSPAALLPRGRR